MSNPVYNIIPGKAINKAITYNRENGTAVEHWDSTGTIPRLEQRIAELETERRWIPVEDRLPENGDESILIFGVYDNAPSVWFCRYVFGFIPYDDLTDMDYFNVTHWMPLPQPPEAIV
jgi:hypothetical protein